MRRGIVLLLAVLALVLSGCWMNQPSPAAHATQAARSQATRTALAARAAEATGAAEPVWLHVAAREEGSVAEHTAALIVDMTVTNRTGASVSLFGDCANPSPRMIVTLPGTHFTYFTDIGVSCPILGPLDVRPPIPTGASHTWTEIITYEMFHIFPQDETMQVGTYCIKASAGWRQGTLAQVTTDHPTALLAGLATAQITFAVH